jgi:hypothetical protein
MDIKSLETVIKEINKIGNYAIPTFGVIITSALAMGSFSKEGPKGYIIIIVDFALYTLLAAFVSYCHRLAWLRRQNAQKAKDEKPSDLPLYAVMIVMGFHFLLIGALAWRLWNHGVL